MENNNDKANLEENLRNFEPLKSKAAEEAKKILFGRALPAEDADILDNTYSRLFQPKTDTSMDIQNEKQKGLIKMAQDRYPEMTPEEIIKKFHETRLEFGNPIPPINWHEEHERFDQINRVLDYCNEAGISPDDLINFYNNHHTQPPK